jgi:hypothetical protein
MLQRFALAVAELNDTHNRELLELWKKCLYNNQLK